MARKTKAKAVPSPYPQHGLARVTQAAEFLNTSKFTVYRLINSEKLAAVEVGGQKRIKWEVLHAYIGAGQDA